MRQLLARLPLSAAATALLLATAGNASADTGSGPGPDPTATATWLGGNGLWIEGFKWSTGFAPGDPNASTLQDVIVPARPSLEPLTLMLQDTRVVRSLAAETGPNGGIVFFSNGGFLDVRYDGTAGSGVLTNHSLMSVANGGMYAPGIFNFGAMVAVGSAVGAVASSFTSGPPGLLDNRGTVDAFGSAVEASTLRNTGTMRLVDSSYMAAGLVENSGALSLTASTLAQVGDFKNSGTATIGADSTLDLTFFGGGTYVQTAGQTTLAGGLLRAPGGIAIAGGRLQGLGELDGAVTVSGGTLAAGNSPGRMELDSLSLHAGTLEVEIDGTASGEFDFYSVAGVAGIGGGQTLGDSFIDFVFDDLPPNSLDLVFLRAADIVFKATDLNYRFFLGDQPLSLAGLYDWSVEMRPTRFGDFLILHMDRVPASSPTPAPVPAPSALGVLAIGLLGLALRHARGNRGSAPAVAC